MRAGVHEVRRPGVELRARDVAPTAGPPSARSPSRASRVDRRPAPRAAPPSGSASSRQRRERARDDAVRRREPRQRAPPPRRRSRRRASTSSAPVADLRADQPAGCAGRASEPRRDPEVEPGLAQLLRGAEAVAGIAAEPRARSSPRASRCPAAAPAGAAPSAGIRATAASAGKANEHAGRRRHRDAAAAEARRW